MGIYL
ncbi:4f73f5dd-5bd7-4079-95a4-d5a9575c56a7 [Thermothielavioides terrestris]